MLQTLNFKGPRQINSKATFFRYESGSAGGADESIRVRADGADLGLYWPGDSVELPNPAALWEIVPTTPACAGTLRVGMGRVQSARLSGRVQVVDEITDQITTAVRGEATTITPFSASQLVAPAANVRGLILRMASCGGAAGAGGQTKVRIVAAKSQPTAYFVPAQCYQLCENFNSLTADQGTTVRMNKAIPPGWGLWMVWEIIGSAPAQGPSAVVQFEAL